MKIHINEQTKIPESKEDVIPVPLQNFSRKFMHSQILYLFRSKDKHQKAHDVLNRKLLKAEAYDYVAIDLDAPTGKQVLYHYAINVAFQKRSKENLLRSISLIDGEKHLDMGEEDFENDIEYLNYLEQVFIVALEMNDYIDTAEAGFADKFESIIGVQNWKIVSIIVLVPSRMTQDTRMSYLSKNLKAMMVIVPINLLVFQNQAKKND